MVIILSILFLVAAFMLLFVFVLLLFMLFDLFLDVPFVGAKKNQIDTIIKLANIKKGETVVDLGSGDGRLLIAAAKKGALALGYEINPLMIVISRIHAGLKGLSENIKVEKRSLWQADLGVADVIFVYAKRKTMQKFEDFVYKNAKKGTRVVVNMNPFPNKKPQKTENGIFLHRV